MSLKHLPLIALLVAPVAAQAAVNEMNEAALSEVHGQATVSGALFSYSVWAALNPDHWGGGFDLTMTPVVGGVQVTTKIPTGLVGGAHFGHPCHRQAIRQYLFRQLRRDLVESR